MHKRLWGSIKRPSSQDPTEKAIPNGDSPEASVARGVRLFCESGGPNNAGEEVLHLPTIVDNAESSPAAATQAALEIRKFLSKQNYQRAYVQYNAIMLVRILADNPGKNFTRNIDSKFTVTVKELLRDGRDMSVQQILRETLDSFETNKPNDETLAGLREMWKKEKLKMEKRGSMAQPPNRMAMVPPGYHQSQQNYFSRNHRPKGLPTQIELAQRVEEAKTSAKLLSQVVQSTPPSELIGNDLIKEFVDRCQSASRSMQSYIHADNPAPDEDTLLTLIETNDQLATAMSKHQRALLQARRATGNSPNPPPSQNAPYGPPSQAPQASPFAAPPPGPPTQAPQASPFAAPPPGPPPGRRPIPDRTNPFDDPSGPEVRTSHENERPEGDLQAPLIPQNYGMPPSTLNGNQQKSSLGLSPNNAGPTDTFVRDFGDERPPGGQEGAKPKYRF